MKVALVILAVAVVGALAQDDTTQAPFVCDSSSAFVCTLKSLKHHTLPAIFKHKPIQTEESIFGFDAELYNAPIEWTGNLLTDLLTASYRGFIKIRMIFARIRAAFRKATGKLVAKLAGCAAYIRMAAAKLTSLLAGVKGGCAASIRMAVAKVTGLFAGVKGGLLRGIEKLKVTRGNLLDTTRNAVLKATARIAELLRLNRAAKEEEEEEVMTAIKGKRSRFSLTARRMVKGTIDIFGIGISKMKKIFAGKRTGERRIYKFVMAKLKAGRAYLPRKYHILAESKRAAGRVALSLKARMVKLRYWFTGRRVRKINVSQLLIQAWKSASNHLFCVVDNEVQIFWQPIEYAA